MANRPEAEIEITPALVGQLLQSQLPDMSSLAIRELSRGWDNTNFRLGEDLLVRVPHRHVAAPLIVTEQQWLPKLASRIDMAIPSPVHCGTPTAFYPWHWSVTQFFEGDEAAQAPLHDARDAATSLGEFFAQLHHPAPSNAPSNPYRGVPLSARASSFHANLALVADHIDTQQIANDFDRAAAATPSTERVWLHGDLHGRNMIVHQGELAAVIDWGDVCAGDRATDLAGAFMLTPNHLDLVQEVSGTTDAQWQRARGWAANFAIIYLAHCEDDPVMYSLGLRLLDTLQDS